MKGHLQGNIQKWKKNYKFYFSGVEMEKPNVIFITTDHQRADTLGMVQCGKEVTPNLNKLSEESINFKRAYTSCPLCVPARTSLATGVFPTKTGVVINELKNIPEKTRELKTIHEYLYEDGYEVNHFGMQHITLIPVLEKRIEFKNFLTDNDYESLCKKENIPIFGVEKDKVIVNELHLDRIEEKKYTGSRVSYFTRDEKLFRDRFYLDNTLKYLKNEDFIKPVALFLNIWAPHPPFNVIREYSDRFKNPILPENINTPSQDEPPKRREGIAAQLSENHDLEHWKNVWSAYLGLTNYADKLIGEVIDILKEKGQYENTIIVFTADHGDHLGQHKMFQKMEMYEQAINVPFIMKLPNSKEKRSVLFPVSHLDIVPTLLDILNIKKTNTTCGESLLKYLESNLNIQRDVYTQYSGNQVAIGDIRRSITTNNYKYIYDPKDEDEFFNLKTDELEMLNIAKNNEIQEKKAVLKNKLKNFLIEAEDWIKI